MTEAVEVQRAYGLVGDQPSLSDKLGYAPYVEAAADFLIDESTVPPLAMSIEGEWGSGKSSFLAQLDSLLSRKKQPYYSVKFNPWRYSEDEALWAAFAIEFENTLLARVGLWQKLKFRWRKLQKWKLFWDIGIIIIPALIAASIAVLALPVFVSGQYLGTLRGVIIAFGMFFPIIPIWNVLAEAKEKVAKGLINFDIKKYREERPDYQGKIPFLEHFHKDIKELATVFAKDKPIFIFIDDLDRCSPEQAVELIQAINLLISENLKAFFILAIDSRKIAAGIGVRHREFIELISPDDNKSIARNTISYGYDFLDKFIQVPFKLPKPRVDDVHSFFQELVELSCEPAPPTPNPKEHKNSGWRYYVDPQGKYLGGFGKDGSTYPNEGIPITKDTIPNDAIEVPYSPYDARDFWDFETSSYYSPWKPEEPEAKIEEIKAETVNFRYIATETRAIIQMAAEFLGHNPRKIKKFFNLYKFHVYIGNKIGLFGKNKEGMFIEGSGITIPQLAKLILINYKWPTLLPEASKYDDIFYYMLEFNVLGEEEFWERQKPITFISAHYLSVLKQWSNNEELLDLIRYEAGRTPSYDEQGRVLHDSNGEPITKNYWSMELIDFGKFLDVSPTYERANVFADRFLHPASLYMNVICDSCGEEIDINNFIISWEKDRPLDRIIELYITHLGKCDKKLPFSSGAGIESDWDARRTYELFYSYDFTSNKEKARVLKFLASIINDSIG